MADILPVEAVAGTRSDLPINLTKYCTGNGTAEDATGFQAALDALPAEGGRLTSPPGKKYRISTGLVLSGKPDCQIDLNGSWIESRVPSGVVLTITNCYRARIDRPRFRLMAGAPSAFMYFTSGAASLGSWWATVYEPVIWSHINMPANCDGIVVDDDNYWVELIRPQMRKLTSGLTGAFRRGVSFLSQSNACKILGGSINHCDVGTYVDSCNSCEMDSTAYEFCTVGIALVDSQSPCGGTMINRLRVEVCPVAVDLSGHTTRTGYYSPIMIGDIANQDGEASRAHEIKNPNNVPINRSTGEYISLDSPWAPMMPGLKIKASNNQGLMPVVEIEQRDSTNPVTSLTVAPGTGAMSGTGTLTVTSTTTPVAFAASGLLRIEGSTAAGARTYEFFSYTGTTGTTFTGVTRALGGSVAQAHEVGAFVRAAGNRTFAIDINGVPTMSSASSTPPTPIDDRLILHHRSFVSKIISWRTDGAGTGNVRLSVGNASSTVVDVVSVFETSMRPGATNTIDLGVTGTRWRNLYLSGVLDHSGTTVGFFGATPATKPTVTGSRGGNAALADLISDLASLGLVTDSSTA